MTAVAEKVLAKEHLSKLFNDLYDRHSKEVMARDGKLPALLVRQTESASALNGLYATARTVPEVAEDPVYQTNLTNALREAKLVNRAIEHAKAIGSNIPKITPEKVNAFTRNVKDLLQGNNRAHAKQALQAIVSCVEVNDETICIVGANEQLSQLVSSEGSDPEEGPPGVPSVRGYVRRWRSERDSNSWYSRAA